LLKEKYFCYNPNMEHIKEKRIRLRAAGRLGGLKGGRARAVALTPERRKEIATLAAKARWKTHRKKRELYT
jgi:hypothetical protein